MVVIIGNKLFFMRLYCCVYKNLTAVEVKYIESGYREDLLKPIINIG